MSEMIWKIQPDDKMPPHIAAIEAEMVSGGRIVITERWNDKSEIWSDGVMVRIPPRIWVEIIEWLSVSEDVSK